MNQVAWSTPPQHPTPVESLLCAFVDCLFTHHLLALPWEADGHELSGLGALMGSSRWEASGRFAGWRDKHSSPHSIRWSFSPL